MVLARHEAVRRSAIHASGPANREYRQLHAWFVLSLGHQRVACGKCCWHQGSVRQQVGSNGQRMAELAQRPWSRGGNMARPRQLSKDVARHSPATSSKSSADSATLATRSATSVNLPSLLHAARASPRLRPESTLRAARRRPVRNHRKTKGRFPPHTNTCTCVHGHATRNHRQHSRWQRFGMRPILILSQCKWTEHARVLRRRACLQADHLFASE
jgi:hypothetical protein